MKTNKKDTLLIKPFTVHFGTGNFAIGKADKDGYCPVYKQHWLFFSKLVGYVKEQQ